MDDRDAMAHAIRVTVMGYGLRHTPITRGFSLRSIRRVHFFVMGIDNIVVDIMNDNTGSSSPLERGGWGVKPETTLT